jgi:hypothetical protein
VNSIIIYGNVLVYGSVLMMPAESHLFSDAWVAYWTAGELSGRLS